MDTGSERSGMAGALARAFVDSKLTPLLVIAAVLLGLAAIILLPREEEPQIKVPMIDVGVVMPGASAGEVEERVTRPMEKLLWEVPGVEYLYSMSHPGESLVIVRFVVGTDVVRALVLLNQKLQMNFDRIPHGVSAPLIKPRSIDDVPILSLTFHSARYDHLTLRRIAAQADDHIKQAANVSETQLIGGARRQLRILLDPAALAARGLSPAGIIPMLQQGNRQSTAGGMPSNNREVVIETGAFIESAEDARNIVVGVAGGRPIYVRDVARVVDGPEKPRDYVFLTHGPAARSHGATAPSANDEPAVTLTVAKRPGANAIAVSRDVLRKLDAFKGVIIPSDVAVTVTRHYGETAAEKSNELLIHMGIAVIGVSLLILIVLGWRESLIVAIAIPATLALTLLVFYLYGYTLNRITLFALIFSIGILVDDAIVVVENIVRHLHLPGSRARSMSAVAIEAVAEVGNPTILATIAVIAAILPMAFVGGLMGPYMRPIPVGSSAAMAWSLLVAFIVTPWAARRLLRKEAAAAHPGTEDFFTRLYRRVMRPLIHHPAWQGGFLLACALLLLGACALVGIGWVKVKMLPFDNKSEFQVILNMPEGSSLEHTARAAREIAASLREEPEVTDIEVYAGTAAPFNFNGLVRHYFMRRGDHVADIQVNLLPKHDRRQSSHDIAKRVRPRVAEIAGRYGARVAVAEVPPGPPVLQTLVAECYGPTPEARQKLADAMIKIFRDTAGVVDVDWYIEADQPEARFIVDKEKAALSGISAETIARTLQIAVDGLSIDLLHSRRDKEDVNIVLEVPEALASRPDDLLAIRVRPGDANALPEPPGGVVAPDQATAPLVPLREIVRVERRVRDKTGHRKNLMPVAYVIGDVAGKIESPVYAILKMNEAIARLNAADFGGRPGPVRVHNATMPFGDRQPSMKWDGEWQITIEVFRDLGMAFAAVLILIYLLMVGWFRSFLTPLIVMAAIPFSLVGILPAHGLLGAFFTATSMIGFMAGAGIVVRNSIILVDFIEQRRREGMALHEAVVDAGAVRFRPMLLTAMAVVVGAAVILFDPIFQGLAIALMAGEIASLFLSRMAVPVLYYLANRGRP
ncbi:MAG TPA: efflux RND transporter permease subunit [Verrucomicrobiae bacterium]|nr:efflux RND transporter permease subunit [Verrucomicrobiae bacterium]